MISVCIPVKNRADNLKRCVESLDAAGVDEIVVADFRSDDTDFKWFNHSTQKAIHKLVTVEDEYFSVGAGKNAAAAAASGDVLFFLDADLTVTKEVINFITDAVADGDVVAPIMQMQNEDGSLGDWAVHSFGQVALLKKDFDSGEKWQPWTSYGGEDNLFIAQYQHRLLRPRMAGFIHHWHAHELREANGESPAYTDLKKFDKEYQPMKIYAHDPRFVFNGRYNSFPDAVVVREIWCENVYEVFDGDLSDTGIVVDIGANIGSFSLYAASLGAKKVIAVEPEPHNLELLRQNILENQTHVPDCEFIVDTHAVGREDSDEAFINDAHGDSQVIRNREMSEGMTKVPMITLDTLFQNNQLEYIDILKIDIEGLEGEVILNASKRTMNLCRYITMEYDEDADDLGAIVEKISQTHQIKFVGAHGGMLFAKRY
jgi:FkbM family methyltransferase